MRILPLLNALALVPVMVVAHGWYLSSQQMPQLYQQLVQELEGLEVEVHEMQFDLLDLRLRGSTQTPEAHAQAMAALQKAAPLRLREVEITLPASLEARSESGRLQLSGTLPSEADVPVLLALLQEWRPDLEIVSDLQLHEAARWPEGEKGDWQSVGSLLQAVRTKLTVDSWLDLTLSAEGTLTAQGMLPSAAMRETLLEALPAGAAMKLENSRLHTSPVAGAVPLFREERDFPALVRTFFSHPGPRQITWDATQGLRLEADALPSQTEPVLALLRLFQRGQIPVKNAIRQHPSRWHMPGRPLESALEPERLRELSLVLEAEPVPQFIGTSALLDEASQARLASLVPELLAAGSGLRLIIGGHPAEDSHAARELAHAQARRVAEALFEAGLPTPAAEVTVFERPTPAPAHSASVEILIR